MTRRTLIPASVCCSLICAIALSVLGLTSCGGASNSNTATDIDSIQQTMVEIPADFRPALLEYTALVADSIARGHADMTTERNILLIQALQNYLNDLQQRLETIAGSDDNADIFNVLVELNESADIKHAILIRQQLDRFAGRNPELDDATQNIALAIQRTHSLLVTTQSKLDNRTAPLALFDQLVSLTQPNQQPVQ